MNTTKEIERKRAKRIVMVLAGTGTVFGLWAAVAFVSLLSQANWSLAEVLRQYMIATGVLSEQQTLVDYYTHIKGAEYIMAVTFLGLFPLFFKYVNPARAQQKA